MKNIEVKSILIDSYDTKDYWKEPENSVWKALAYQLQIPPRLFPRNASTMGAQLIIFTSDNVSIDPGVENEIVTEEHVA